MATYNKLPSTITNIPSATNIPSINSIPSSITNIPAGGIDVWVNESAVAWTNESAAQWTSS